MKIEQPVKINGLPFYLVIQKDTSGNILQLFEKPDLKQINNHISGEHIIVDNSLECHYDHFSGAITWKEYPNKEGLLYESKYLINGSEFTIKPEWNNSASFAIISPN